MKALARVVLVLGAAGIGTLLLRAAPREVTLVYLLPEGPAPARIEVDISRGTELVRRADIAVLAGAREVRHRVRLPDGDYQVSIRSGSALFERTVTVAEAGDIVLPLQSRVAH